MFQTAAETIQGYDAMDMIRKGQISGGEKGDIWAREIFCNRTELTLAEQSFEKNLKRLSIEAGGVQSELRAELHLFGCILQFLWHIPKEEEGSRDGD